MGGIVLCLNEVDPPLDGHAVVCPYCGGSNIHRWGSGKRNVHDIKPINAVISRFFCVDCARTFRYYPEGLDRSQISRRVRRLAGLLWLMDVSTRDVEDIFKSLGVRINRMTVWREGQKLLSELTHRKLLNPEHRVALHRTNGSIGTGERSLSFSICLDSNTITTLGKLNVRSEESAASWLRKVLAGQEIEIALLSDFNFSSVERVCLPL